MPLNCNIQFSDEQLSAQRKIFFETIEQIRLRQGLITAILQNDTEAVKLWLNMGADPNAFANLRHQIPIVFLVISDIYDDDELFLDDENHVKGTPYFVPMPGNKDIMTALLDAGADIDKKDVRGDTALMLAVRFAPAGVITFLASYGANVNVRCNNDQYALHYAVDVREVDIVVALLNNGADINVQDYTGKTPLMAAINNMFGSSSRRMGKPTVIEELLKCGADVNLRDRSGKTALDYLPKGFFHTLGYGSWVRKIRKKIEMSTRNKK